MALLLRAQGLDRPDQPYFDEIYYVPAARDYLEGRPDANNVHPPGGKLQIAAGMLVVEALGGKAQLGWRSAACLLGVGTVAMGYLLALFLTDSSRTALLTAFLLTFDFLQVVESRIATLDMPLTFWSTAGLAACAHAFFRREQPASICLAGLCFGAATACKWSGLLLPAGVLLWLWWDRRRVPLRVGAVFLGAIAVVYLACYTPVFARLGGADGLAEIVGYHTRMWTFHYDPDQFRHRYLSQFYEWPLVLRPVWFHFRMQPGTAEGVVALGSPIFWWFSALLLLDQLRRRSDRVGRFVLLGYLWGWLPWALSTTGGFLYYLLPVTPLMAVLVARELADWWEEPLSRALAVLYLVVLLVVFGLYYPLLTARTVSYDYYRVLFLYRGWY